ncbi:hypothetical protein MMC10_000812 [Thelotrema lepadinum]|nr:hypothetical protein [Thelotrema lepadinum]
MMQAKDGFTGTSANREFLDRLKKRAIEAQERDVAALLEERGLSSPEELFQLAERSLIHAAEVEDRRREMAKEAFKREQTMLSLGERAEKFEEQVEKFESHDGDDKRTHFILPQWLEEDPPIQQNLGTGQSSTAGHAKIVRPTVDDCLHGEQYPVSEGVKVSADALQSSPHVSASFAEPMEPDPDRSSPLVEQPSEKEGGKDIIGCTTGASSSPLPCYMANTSSFDSFVNQSRPDAKPRIMESRRRLFVREPAQGIKRILGPVLGRTSRVTKCKSAPAEYSRKGMDMKRLSD